MSGTLDPAVGASDKPAQYALASHVIFTRYVLFAVISGLANIAFQQIVIWTLPSLPIMASVLTGTGVGFVVKYVLDKKWVFLDTYDGHAAELRKVIFYGFFGVATTILFWAVELGFWHIWLTAEAKYTGAVIGLAAGNLIKYLLDRHYVFRKPAA
jgi:putative flippase GtrA